MKSKIVTNVKIGFESQGVSSQLKSIFPAIIACYVPVFLFLAALVAAVLLTHIPMYYFMRDPAQTLNAPSYIGLSSNLGALLWCSSVVICFHSFAVLRKGKEVKNVSGFFLFAGLLTAVVMLDDFFVIHENISLHFEGIFSYAMYALTLLYVVPLLAFVLFYARTILNTDYLLLVLAVFFFGLSFLVDLSKDLGLIIFEDWLRILLEDGFKLLGITGWLSYFARTSVKHMSITRN
jgi:hypothetical protein